MGKLYKIEFEDFGWGQLLGFLDSDIREMQNHIERLEKEKQKTKDEWLIDHRYEGLIGTYKSVIGLTKGYMREIRRQLKEQNLELPLLESEKTATTEHIT